MTIFYTQEQMNEIGIKIAEALKKHEGNTLDDGQSISTKYISQPLDASGNGNFLHNLNIVDILSVNVLAGKNGHYVHQSNISSIYRYDYDVTETHINVISYTTENHLLSNGDVKITITYKSS